MPANASPDRTRTDGCLVHHDPAGDAIKAALSTHQLVFQGDGTGPLTGATGWWKTQALAQYLVLSGAITSATDNQDAHAWSVADAGMADQQSM
jgi:hypothetical protein